MAALLRVLKSNHVAAFTYSRRHDLVLGRFTSFEPVNGIESGHLPVEPHSAQAAQLTDEGERE
jgi:hypothetical protein